MAHVHAALMAEYAKDAAEIDEPWTRWEYKPQDVDVWFTANKNLSWHCHFKYRRKPQPIPTKIVYQWAINRNHYWFIPGHLYTTEVEVYESYSDVSAVRRLDYTALEVPA